MDYIQCVESESNDEMLAKVHLVVTAWESLCRLKNIEYKRAYKHAFRLRYGDEQKNNNNCFSRQNSNYDDETYKTTSTTTTQQQQQQARQKLNRRLNIKSKLQNNARRVKRNCI